jgi:hypothetical protein
MSGMGRHFDVWSLLATAITPVLWVAALCTKGFTHDLLPEAGVFLASVKLVRMAYKNSVVNDAVPQRLDATHRTVQWLREANAPPRARPPMGRDCRAAGVADRPRG